MSELNTNPTINPVDGINAFHIADETIKEDIPFDNPNDVGAISNDNISNGAAIPISTLITGEKAAKLLDIAVSNSLSLLLKAFKKDVKPSQLRADKTELEILSITLNDALSRIKINIENPYIMISLALLAVYGSKVSSAFFSEPIKNNSENQGNTQGETIKKRGRPKKY